MSIEEVREINKAWEQFFQDIYDPNENGDYTSYWHYEPFSDGYWNEKQKIVFCNVEAHGSNYKNCVMKLENVQELITKNKKTAPSLIRSALFLYCLYKKLHGITVTEEKLAEMEKQGKLSKNYDELLDGIKNTTYMNLRKEENITGKSKEDKDGLRNSLVPGLKYKNDNDPKNYEYNEYNRKLTLEFIDALEPDIFIITGELGWDVLKKIYKDKIELHKLPKWGMYKTAKTLYVSMEHPSPLSIPSIDEWIKLIVDKAGKIYEELQK